MLAVSVALCGCTGGSTPGASGAKTLTVAPPSAVKSTALTPSPTGTPTGPPATAMTSAAASWTYTRYVNPRLGFGIDVPSTFVEGPPPEDSDGASWNSTDRSTTLVAYGAYNVVGDTPESALARYRGEAVDDGGTVTYTSVTGTVYVCSGYTRTGSIFYARGVVYPRAEYDLEWTYPRSLKTDLDPPVEHSAATFTPGPAQ